MYISGVGQISACGAGVGALEAALRQGPPTPELVAIEHVEPVVKVPVLRAPAPDLGHAVSSRVVRRMDGFSLGFVAAALQAVADAGGCETDSERVGVVAATGYGSLKTSFALLDEIIEEGDDAVSPIRFSAAVNNAPSTSVSAVLGARGPCLTVIGFDRPFRNALSVAESWFRAERVDAVMVVAGDEYHSVLGYALWRRCGLAANGVVRPFALDMCSYVPGEMFVALLLTRSAQSPGYGWVWARTQPVPASEVRRPGDALLLHADGSRAAAALQPLADGHPDALAVTPIAGGSPTAAAMTVASAAVLLRQRFTPSWATAKGGVPGGLAVWTADAATIVNPGWHPGGFDVVRVSRDRVGAATGAAQD